MSKVYTRDEVVEASTQYFNGDKLAAGVFANKYSLKNSKLEYTEDNPEVMHKRMAKEFARAEAKFPNPMSEEEIFKMFDHFNEVVPGGSSMFGLGNNFQKVSLSNCFVIDTVDSYGGICRTDERIVQISKRRGGVGVDISPIRPKGMSTRNSAFTTDGIVVFMDRFSNSAREVAQNGRRGALMISISVHHPEIMNFIRVKRDLEKVTGANISVRVTDEFMKAVKKDKPYEQRWPVDSATPSMSAMVDAKEVWNEMIKSVYLSAEPGILFWDTIIRNSPADSYAHLGFKTTSTNPCITGETLVYVADGRGDVSIKELADEGKDVPVFCYDDKGKLTIETMRHPRVTGYNEPIYKVTLDDGSTVRATANHKFLTSDGEYKRVDEIKEGESLKILTKYEASMSSSIKAESGSRSKTLYNWLTDKFRGTRGEHRYIAEHVNQRELCGGEIVHHKDYNGLNNSPDNLKVMGYDAHNKFHARDMMGDNNPMRRAKHEWSEEKWQQYHNTMSKAVSGELNGRFTGFSNKEVREHAIELTKNLNRRFSKRDWQKYARNNNLPIEFSDWRKDNIGSVLNLSKWASIEVGIEYVDEDPRLVKTLKLMIEQGYNSFIDGDKVFVEKSCEECGSTFTREHLQREVSFCSGTCANFYKDRHGVNEKRTDTINATYKKKSDKNKHKQLKIFTGLKFNLGRMPLLKEWEKECKSNGVPCRFKTKYGFESYKKVKESAETFNHRVVSVELDGYEDVYNGTVDKFHNFFIGGFKGLTRQNNRKSLYVNNLNCGELPLCEADSCRLMSINLMAMVDDPFTDKAKFNDEKYKNIIRKSMRLMDDLVELELEAVDGIIQKIKSDPEADNVKGNELNLWEQVKEKCSQGRRTGLGVTALGDCIAMLGIKYGDKDSLKMVDKIYKMLRDESYRASIEMAKERGSFPIYDSKLEKDNEFIQRLPEDILKDMKKHGRRNIGCLTTAPSGSISVVAQTSSGFEPVFKAKYVRKRKISESENVEPDFVDELGDKWKEYEVLHHGLTKYKEITGKGFEGSPYDGAQANELDHSMRVKMQATATKYVCHAISSTINLPKDVDFEVVESLYMQAWEQGCKGLTVYREESRDGVLTSSGHNTTRTCEDCDEAGKQFAELVKGGLRPSAIILSASPTRPKALECDIQRSRVGGGDWIFLVGKLNGQPYEIFGGDSNEFAIPHKYKKGWIVKNGKVDGVTQYNLILGSLDDENEKLEFKGIAKHFNNYEYGAFTRLCSLTIRHGTPVKYICEQIIKKGVEGELFSFQRAMARVLKKYIGDDEKSETECEECGAKEMVYRAGCPTCMVCGHSKCA